MSEIITKIFEDKTLRIEDRSGVLWFVADDVTKGLEIKNGPHAVASLDPDERGTICLTDSALGGPERNIISEAGFYKLVGKSRKPAAKAFQRWVTHEVLPSIRKTGSFNAAPDFDSPDFHIRYVEHLRGKVAEHESRLKIVEPRARRAARCIAASASF
jgi:anti-repressor protein